MSGGGLLLYDASLSIRHRLKASTEQAHVSLEARIGPLDTQSAYNEYLLGLYAFRRCAEDWLLSRTSPAQRAWQPQKIAALLHQDINDLGLPHPNVSPVSWETDAGESFVMGVHYVLEGSALGARVLYKQVAALGLHRTHGARHLWAQAATLESWRGYLALLNDYHGDETALIAGANAAFNAAAGAMERAACV